MKVTIDKKKILIEAEYDEILSLTALNDEELHIISVELPNHDIQG